MLSARTLLMKERPPPIYYSATCNDNDNKNYYFFCGVCEKNGRRETYCDKFYIYNTKFRNFNVKCKLSKKHSPRFSSSIIIRQDPKSSDKIFIIFGGVLKKRTKYDESFLLEYNSTTNKFQVLKYANSPPQIAGHRGLYFESVDKMFTFGGYTHDNRKNLNTIFVCDFKNKRWEHREFPQSPLIKTRIEETGVGKNPSFQVRSSSSRFPIAPKKRGFHSMNKVDDSSFVIFGGFNFHEKIYFNDVWVYNIEYGTWKEIRCRGQIPTGRSSHASIIVNENGNSKLFYVYGGGNNYRSYFNDLFELNLTNFVWKKYSVENGPKIYGHSIGVRHIHLTEARILQITLFCFGGNTTATNDDKKGTLRTIDDMFEINVNCSLQIVSKFYDCQISTQSW